MPSTAILAPLFALVLVTFVVWCFMLVERIGEMRRRHIHPQSVATSRQRMAAFDRTNGADNFRNLLELPVLFCVLCLLLVATGTITTPLVVAAWLFVALRAAHSVIQCTYNRVMHRFAVYVASSLVLFAMWAMFAGAFAVA